MRRVIDFFFLAVLCSHILLSRRPTDVNYAVLLHVLSLAGLLGCLALSIAAREREQVAHRYSAWILLFVVYFSSVGVVTSFGAGAPTREVFEFPYRIANLLIALLYPVWLATESDVRFVLRAGLALVVGQALRDLLLGGFQFGNEVLSGRLWTEEFASLLFLASVGFLMGWAVADWEYIRKSSLLKAVLVASTLVISVKVVLLYSRAVWIGMIPMDIALVFFLLRGPGAHRVRRPMVAVAMLFLVGGLAVLAASETAREIMAYRFSYLDASAGRKLDEFNAVLAASTDTWFLGKGFGSSVEFWKGDYYVEQGHVHNYFLQFLLSSGVVGLAVFLWGVQLLALGTWRLQRRAATAVQQGASLAVTLTLANIALIGAVQSIFRREETYLMIALCIVLLVATERSRTNGSQVSTPSLGSQ